MIRFTNLISVYFGVLVVFVSIVTLRVQRTHFLIALLCLEAIMLGLFYFLAKLLFMGSLEIYLSFVLLTFRACEACVGLALLVSLARIFGKDYLRIISLHKC